MQVNKALVDEFTYIETLESGLKVVIHPKMKYQRLIVTLQVHFGGVDMEYNVGDKYYKIPEGVAHFLEHSLFQNNGRNLSEEFAKYGAKINAFTSKSETAYSFECRNDFNYLIDYFLSSFLKPEFSVAAIEKEKKIIQHELMMSEDSIHTEIYQKLKNMIYADKAICADVGGTVKEVMSINKDILTQVFNTFYHPKNMSLVITGNCNPEVVLAVIKNHAYNLNKWPEFETIKRVQDRTNKRIHNFVKKTKEVEENIINIGIKIPYEIFDNYSREYIHVAISSIIGNTFGLGSRNYDYLEKRKMMNISFSAKSTIERDYGFINIYMQNKNPKKYLSEIVAIILRINEEDLDEELFNIDKKAILGNYIRLFDSLPRTHEFISNCILEDVDISKYLQNILDLKIEDLNPMRAIFKKENIYVIQYLKK
ncbi:MAG: insulinase family protein [Tenericutes bacterium]|nr:insulinase family protein [Mycoplasmatota bacterium]